MSSTIQNQSTSRTRIVFIIGTLLVGALLVGGIVTDHPTIGDATATTNQTNQTQNQTETHTLEIIYVEGGGEYTFSAYGNVSYVSEYRESSDRSVEGMAKGSVSSNDKRDVITFSDAVLSFEYNPGIRVKLDGKRVDPRSLSGTSAPETITSTPTATATSTPSNATTTPRPTLSPFPTTTVSDTATPAPTVTISPTATDSPTNTPNSSTDSEGNEGGTLGFNLSFVLAIAAVIVFVVLWRVE